MKNIDIIRKMSIKELAEWLDEVQVDGMTGNGSDTNEWIKYLTSEAKDSKRVK